MLALPTWMRVLGVSLMGHAEEAAWHHMCTFSPKTWHTTGEMERSPQGGRAGSGGEPAPPATAAPCQALERMPPRDVQGP